MKLNILSDDFELVNKLKEIKTMSVKSITQEEINESDVDILVISNRIISLNKLLTIKTTNSKCFYLSDVDDINLIEKLDQSILDIKKICIVPPKRTIEQIKEFLINSIYKTNNENNVFSFFGTDSKVGTTSIAQAVAINLSKRHKNKKTLMLFLDGQTGFDWVENSYIKSSLSDIKVALKNNFLTISNLKENCYQYTPNLYLLKGEVNIEEDVFYHQNDINALIEICKENFDFVIIDSGNILNLPLRMTYSALINSDNKILITDQLPKSYWMYIKGKEQVLDKLKIGDFKFLVLNKYMHNNILPKKEDIADKYLLPIISVLPYLDYYYQAAAEKSISMFETEKSYKSGILAIVQYIEKKCGLVVEENTKKSLISFIRR